jgi:hypothetical protein
MSLLKEKRKLLSIGIAPRKGIICLGISPHGLKNARLFGYGGRVSQYKGERGKLLGADENEYEIPSLECQKDARVDDRLRGYVRVRANSSRGYVLVF